MHDFQNFREEWIGASVGRLGGCDDYRLLMNSETQMNCHEKRSLLRKYTLYLRAYSEAAGQVLAVSSQATRSEWDLAWELANRARFLCVDTLNELKVHTAEHSC